jgi:hypothetical protein
MKTNEKQLQLVTCEQAKRLRKSGFDWKCGYCYDNQGKAWDLAACRYSVDHPDVFAPTVALALKWIRDEKSLFGCVDFAIANFRKGYYYNYFSFSDKNITGKTEKLFGAYEAAESVLLDELLNILEKENCIMQSESEINN